MMIENVFGTLKRVVWLIFSLAVSSILDEGSHHLVRRSRSRTSDLAKNIHDILKWNRMAIRRQFAAN